MSAHSKILGGSNAARLLACPASYVEQMKSPLVDTESPYASEGTALHQAIAHCIEHKARPADLTGEFYGHEITAERVEVLDKALAYLQGFLATLGDPKRFKVVGLEQTLPLPGVTGAFGSVDLIVADRNNVVVIDWKFGQGIPVVALYRDPQRGDLLNPQAMFYCCAGRAKYRRRFRGKRIHLAIVQPRLDTLSDVEVDNEELDDFLSAFQAAYIEALGRNAHREKGEWCRFASCKATCPFWVGPVIDLAVISPVHAALQTVEPSDFGEFLSRALTMVEFAEGWAEEIRRQAHVYLEDGGLIPDWKLVAKRATRKWRDEDITVAQLREEGFEDSMIYTEPAVRSVAQMEKALGKKNVDPDLWHAVSSGNTLAHGDDPRPNATHAEVMTELRKALKAL